MPNRCQCKTLSKHVCKNKNKFIIQNLRFCTIHAQYYFNKLTIKIQSIYKGYKTRKKLKNLFYNLPLELQKLVVKHMRELHYIQKTNKTISKIISNKFDNIFGNPNIYHNNLIYTNEMMNQNKLFYYEQIINITNLFIKYNKITNHIYDNRLFYLINIIIKVFKQNIINNLIYDENNINISNDILLQKYALMLYIKHKYNSIYKDNYSDGEYIHMNNEIISIHYYDDN
tara:strand:+ start:398 stop:1081 length:684 start_codon:yes stop_codon:yes gene_type:complete